MIARARKFLSDLQETFWVAPGFMVLIGVVAAIGFVKLDRAGIPAHWLNSSWLYNGGATGARTLLGVVAGSTIGVASTVFSITIAALSLAVGQMGPRLLRNFTRDRGNQLTLGVLLGTFSYALVVLRSVRTQEEGDFVPHLAMSVAILLALFCVAMLVYFVGHMANRISVDTVIDLVSADVHAALQRLTETPARVEMSAPPRWTGAVSIIDLRRGYLQQLDEDGLADWAAENHTAIRLLVRPGHYIFPGAPIAEIAPWVEDCEAAMIRATALGPQRAGPADIEFAALQLVEVAVRALSPGINDPHTAISVLDKLGAALCSIAPLTLRSGVRSRDGHVVLTVPEVDYEGLTGAMFHMIRQNAAGSAAVLIRMLQVLTAIASCERDPGRLKILAKHADLVMADARRSIPNPSDLADVAMRFEDFEGMRRLQLS